MTTELQKKLKLLRKELRGSYGIVAGEAGVEVSTVSRVLKGEFFNELVINKAIEIRDRQVAKYQDLANRI